MATTQQLTTKYTNFSGAESTVTGTATYVSSAPSVATVSSGGLITAVAAGTATVTATYGDRSDTCAVTVTT